MTKREFVEQLVMVMLTSKVRYNDETYSGYVRVAVGLWDEIEKQCPVDHGLQRFAGESSVDFEKRAHATRGDRY